MMTKAMLVPEWFPAAPCRKLNVPRQIRNTDIPSCNSTIKSNKGLTRAIVEGWERENTYLRYNACRHRTNMFWAVPIVSGAPVGHYVNIPSVPHHDYIQTLSRKWFHIQHLSQSSSLRWWTFPATDLPDQERGWSRAGRAQCKGLTWMVQPTKVVTSVYCYSQLFPPD